MGTLYLVGTPIGNLEDITLRALRTLREVALVAAEDTRSARRLLSHYGIETSLTSYWEHNELTKIDTILTALGHGDVALVSEAGMPGLSDPGYHLVRAAVRDGHTIRPVPGPTAPITALVASGLPTDRFTYLGFLPRRAAARRRLLAEVAPVQHSLVAFEVPHRLVQALEDIHEILGDRQIAIARELTKVHEEIWRGHVAHAQRYFGASDPLGEFTLVIAGAELDDSVWAPERVQTAVEEFMEAGVPRREAVKATAEMAGWSAQRVYRLALQQREG